MPTFRSMMHAADGHFRVVIRKEELAPGLGMGSVVNVTIDVDAAPRVVDIPGELAAVFENDPELLALFEQMAPSHRRAWAQYVGEAKQPNTRLARAARAPEGIRSKAFPR